jgi:hypothetical protein
MRQSGREVAEERLSGRAAQSPFPDSTAKTSSLARLPRELARWSACHSIKIG